MSIQTAATLKKLAIQSLVRDEALAISSLEDLPSVLFPALFKEAFSGRQTKLIKAMLAAWPFPCLPVGALMKTPKLEMLQAVLDGIDMRLTKGFHPRHLMTPLSSLSVTHYQLSQSDLDSFSHCQSVFQLKHLEMRGVVLTDLDLMPMKCLLQKVADTLETMDFQGCRMKDSQLIALLPALTHCSQLTKINFYNNCFSMPILKDLLEHTVNWSKMNVEQYPAPLECYDRLAHVSRVRFSQLCLQLLETLRAIRQPKNIFFATDNCPKCGEC
ncbi:PRAME family member 8-like isoform X3 [Apodemus sylvaticus]|uniref:PRAME family member 8-like isoform X3 n=1 Tax=Apodemus sylvaticus TaxID=10129 RepID=UPI002242C000|nr:PRAME family member 8-like isoform X3 [Apodemus sylvaticus]